MCPLGWRLIVVSMESVWREKAVDLGVQRVDLAVQSNETFGNDSNNAGANGIDTATKSGFEMPEIATKGFDCFRGFDVHRQRRRDPTIVTRRLCRGPAEAGHHVPADLVRPEPDTTYEERTRRV